MVQELEAKLGLALKTPDFSSCPPPLLDCSVPGPVWALTPTALYPLVSCKDNKLRLPGGPARSVQVASVIWKSHR
jgi:hypothetical protein